MSSDFRNRLFGLAQNKKIENSDKPKKEIKQEFNPIIKENTELQIKKNEHKLKICQIPDNIRSFKNIVICNLQVLNNYICLATRKAKIYAKIKHDDKIDINCISINNSM